MALTQITSEGIKDDEVKTADILNANVTSAKLADGSVTGPKLATESVSTVKIEDGAVTADKLAADVISADKIADNAVVTASINADAVTAAKIADNAVVTAAINADAVTGAKIADDAVGSEHIEVLDAALQFGDSVKAQFGAGNDVEVFHDGTDSIIKDNRDSGTLRIQADSIGFNDKDVSETMLLATADGSVDLYYNGTKKLETTTTGAKVTNATTPLVEVQNSTDTSYSGVKLEQSSGSGGYFAINKLGTNSSATGGANAAQIWQSGNAPIVIGVNNTEEARFLSGGGLTFNGDTAAANALDDYEEGTFTPTIGGWSGSGTGTYNSQLGRYTKVGNLVTVWYRVTWTNLTGASGVLCVQSLPFAASNSPDWNNSSSCMIENVDLPNSGTGITGHQFSTSSSSILYYVIQDNASWNALSINTSGTILGTASYPTNA